MIKKLNAREQHFTTSESEAYDVVEKAQDENGKDLIGQSIMKKSNKNGEYYLVQLDFCWNTPLGIQESELGLGD